MAKRKGEMTVQEAAVALEVSEATIRKWAKDRLFGENSPLTKVRVDWGGRYYVLAKDVTQMRDFDSLQIFEALKQC